MDNVIDISSEELMAMDDRMTPTYKWGDGLHAIQILMDMRRTFGYEFAQWDDTVLLRRVEQEFGAISEVTTNKILAIQVALLNDSTWIDFDVFEKTGISFSNKIPLWGTLQPLELHEMAFTCGVLDRIDDDNLWGDEVRGYISAVLLDNGVVVTPKDCPLPETNDLNRHMISDEAQKAGAIAVDRWSKGIMSAGDDLDPVDILLAKFFIIQTMYNEGEKYVTPRRETTG